MTEKFVELQNATQTAINDMSERIKEQAARRWRDNDQRLRVMGGSYDGIPLETAVIAQSIAEAKANHKNDSAELDALTQSLESTRKAMGKNEVEAHFDMLRQRRASIKGMAAHDGILQTLEDAAIRNGRNNSPNIIHDNGAEFRTQAVTTAANAQLTVPTLDATFWMDMQLEPTVAGRVPAVTMGRDKHRISNMDDVLVDALDIGSTLANLVGRSPGETANTADTDPNFEQVELTARTIHLATSISQDELEDSVINLAAEVRSTMVRAGMYGLDNFVINSDSDATATAGDGSTGNVSNVGGPDSRDREGGERPSPSRRERASQVRHRERGGRAGGVAFPATDFAGARPPSGRGRDALRFRVPHVVQHLLRGALERRVPPVRRGGAVGEHPQRAHGRHSGFARHGLPLDARAGDGGGSGVGYAREQQHGEHRPLRPRTLAAGRVRPLPTALLDGAGRDGGGRKPVAG